MRRSKCEVPACNELATRKIWVKCTPLKVSLPRLWFVCDGHAFTKLGSEASDDICICPVCLTHFPLECLDGQKKVEQQKQDFDSANP